jgi:hypothetical protein
MSQKNVVRVGAIIECGDIIPPIPIGKVFRRRAKPIHGIACQSKLLEGRIVIGLAAHFSTEL